MAAKGAAPSSGVTVKDVPADLFIDALAAHFKKTQKIELPPWHDLVKTGTLKQLPPQNPDWYFIRTAALARRVYLNGGRGVGTYSRIFGGRKRNGVAPEHHGNAARGIIRHAFHALQKIDIIAVDKTKRGRRITKNGQRELDTIAGQIKLPASILAATLDKDA